MRNGRFLADLMDRALSFRQEMRPSKPRDIHDGPQSSALRPAVVSGSAHSGGGAFALSWIAFILNRGLKASGRPRASLALGLRAQTTFPGRRRSDYLGKFSTVRRRSPCSRTACRRSRRTRRPWCVNAASCDGQKSGALSLSFFGHRRRRAYILSDTARHFPLYAAPAGSCARSELVKKVRVGMCEAGRPVRSAQSWPLVARTLIVRVRPAIAANPSDSSPAMSSTVTRGPRLAIIATWSAHARELRGRPAADCRARFPPLWRLLEFWTPHGCGRRSRDGIRPRRPLPGPRARARW